MAANKSDLDKDVVAAGRTLYEKPRERLEATDKGSFVLIDAVSGDYEVDPSPAAAKRRIGRQLSCKAVSIRRVGRKF